MSSLLILLLTLALSPLRAAGTTSALLPAEMGKKALRTLLVQSQHADYEVRAAAASAWGAIGNPSARKILQKFLTDTNPYVRIEAAYSLHLLGFDEGTSAVKKLLEFSTTTAVTKAEGPSEILKQLASEKIRVQAVDRISRFGSVDSVAILENSLKDPSPAVRDATAIALARIGFDEFSLQFIEALESKDPRDREEGARSMGKIERPLGQRYLLEAAEDANDRVRAAVMGALGNFPDSGMVPILKKGLKDKNPLVRAQAVSSLIRLPERSAQRALKGVVKANKIPAITLKALTGLASYGQAVRLKMVRQALWQSDPDPKFDAIRILRYVKTQEAVELLRGAMEDDKDIRVRIQAAEALIVRFQRTEVLR